MLISHRWLLEFADFEIVVPEPEALARALTNLGLAVDELIGVEGDTLFDLDIPANRPDCMNHLGLARELAAFFGLQLRPPNQEPPDPAPDTDLHASVEIRECVLCPRYAARLIQGVRIEPSPPWLQERLLSVGQRPVNNVVDATNYVLQEMGHPMHAFDYDSLRENRIVVRCRLPHEDRLRTLDGETRQLVDDTLLICDGSRPVAVAGVMGGLESEVSIATSNLLLESAYFDPASIRATSKRLGLSTEASYRFERGADREAPVRALNRCCHLILELAGGRCSGPVLDEYPGQISPQWIDLTPRRISQVIGKDLDPAFVTRTLESLSYQITEQESGWRVKVPTFRVDCSHPDDLVEDLLRHHGYDRIESTYPPSHSQGRRLPDQMSMEAVIEALLGAGYSEAVTLAFTTPESESAFHTSDRTLIGLGNPLSEDLTHLRSTLAAGLVSSLRTNFNFGSRQVRLFELGKVFESGPQPVESMHLGLVASGSADSQFWAGPAAEFTFFHMKGLIEALADTLGQQFRFESSPIGFLHEGISASIYESTGDRVGWVGRLNPALEQEYKLNQPIFLAEISLQKLLKRAPSEPRFKDLDRFPSSDRDISFLVDNEVQYGTITDAIKALSILELRDIQPIDFYHDRKLPTGKKSLTIRLTFANPERTLQQDEIAVHASAVFDQLSARFGAQLRS